MSKKISVHYKLAAGDSENLKICAEPPEVEVPGIAP